MSSVWIVEHYEQGDGCNTLAVFSTFDAAEAYAATLRTGKPEWYESWTVKEWEVRE